MNQEDGRQRSPESAKKSIVNSINIHHEQRENLDSVAEDIERQEMEEGKVTERKGVFIGTSPDKLKKVRA